MKLGILGGTFDPIHVGHVAAASSAVRALALDRLVLIPSRLPPHRPDAAGASAEDRLAMAALAATEHPNWSASDVELKRDGPSYTFDTLGEFGRQGHAASEIYFIIGADAFAEIATWSRYPAVMTMANFAVVSRPGITLDSLPAHELVGHTRVIPIEAATPDVSSTMIRQRVRAGGSILGLVPASVAHYISQHHLYVGAGL